MWAVPADWVVRQGMDVIYTYESAPDGRLNPSSTRKYSWAVGTKGSLMALKTLKTNVPMLGTMRMRVVEVKAGTTERMRGRAWMEARKRIGLRDRYQCAACGLVRLDHEVDHRIPLEQGGSNEDVNLQLLCAGPGRCHAAKTAAEVRARFGASQ